MSLLIRPFCSSGSAGRPPPSRGAFRKPRFIFSCEPVRGNSWTGPAQRRSVGLPLERSPALAEALRERALVVFCGAGVRWLAFVPPGLARVQHFVLDEARTSALAMLPELDPESRRGARGRSGWRRYRWWRSPRPSCARSPGLLVPGAPRAGRRAAEREPSRARGARAPACPAGCHLDQLRHADRARVPRARGRADVYEKARDYHVTSGVCALYKIHGSAKKRRSLVTR